jgi:hypothetical protein
VGTGKRPLDARVILGVIPKGLRLGISSPSVGNILMKLLIPGRDFTGTWRPHVEVSRETSCLGGQPPRTDADGPNFLRQTVTSP